MSEARQNIIWRSALNGHRQPWIIWRPSESRRIGCRRSATARKFLCAKKRPKHAGQETAAHALSSRKASRLRDRLKIFTDSPGPMSPDMGPFFWAIKAPNRLEQSINNFFL